MEEELETLDELMPKEDKPEEELETLDELMSTEDKPEEEKPKAKPAKAPRERERSGSTEDGAPD